jgi:hypothetical protein
MQILRSSVWRRLMCIIPFSPRGGSSKQMSSSSSRREWALKRLWVLKSDLAMAP